MKIYSVIITVIAVAAAVAAGVFYSQKNRVALETAVFQKNEEKCQTDKSKVESQLTETKSRMVSVQKEAAVLSAVSSSFMIPGDLKALTVGSREAVEVEEKIGALTDKMERMGIEKDWNDFKSTLRLNAILGLTRNLAQGLERNLSQQSGSGNQSPPRQPVQ